MSNKDRVAKESNAVDIVFESNNIDSFINKLSYLIENSAMSDIYRMI